MTDRATPGPWTFVRHFMLDGFLVTTKSDQNKHGINGVALVTDDPFTGKRREANARLIAAAPETAAALERVTAERDALAVAFETFIYEVTHLATPETIGGREYRKTLVPYSAIKDARAALATKGVES